MKNRYILFIVTMVAGAAFTALSEQRDYYYREPLESYFEPVVQRLLLEGYETSAEPGICARNAYLMSRLWAEGRLGPEIKNHLVDNYYSVVLVQGGNKYNAPNFAVQCQQSFPFPSSWVRFTPSMYKNGQVNWDPKKAQTEHAMCQNGSIVTSWTGGEFEKGDVVFYEIKIEEMLDGKVVWERVLRTNEVVLQKILNATNVSTSSSTRSHFCKQSDSAGTERDSVARSEYNDLIAENQRLLEQLKNLSFLNRHYEKIDRGVSENAVRSDFGRFTLIKRDDARIALKIIKHTILPPDAGYSSSNFHGARYVCYVWNKGLSDYKKFSGRVSEPVGSGEASDIYIQIGDLRLEWSISDWLYFPDDITYTKYE